METLSRERLATEKELFDTKGLADVPYLWNGCLV